MGRPSLHDDEPTTCRPLRRPASVGDVIGGKYRLADTLGTGGMGRVYAAYHLMLDTKVALKFMHPHLLRDPVAVARFAREARAAATLKSAYAARIFDVDQLPSGELFIVMEYLEGHSLETVAASGRGLPTAEAVRHVLQACDALAEAHAQGIVHLDVKPANLFLTRGRSAPAMIKVLDFGLAKSMDPQAFVSGSPETLGTPRYMSPEQIRGAREVDARTDVWSIGVTLYELLAGRAAFDGQTASLIFERVLAGSFTPLHTHRPDVPPALSAVIERCLAREPAARFATVTELCAALTASVAVPQVVAPGAVAAAPAVAPARYATTLQSAGPGAPPSERPATCPVTWSHRPAWSSYPPAALTMPSAPPSSHETFTGVDRHVPEGPTLAQTILAALTGPALVAAVAAGVACFLGTAHLPALRAAHLASSPAAVAVAAPVGATRATPTLLSARAAALPARAKATTDDARVTPRVRSPQAATRR